MAFLLAGVNTRLWSQYPIFSEYLKLLDRIHLGSYPSSHGYVSISPIRLHILAIAKAAEIQIRRSFDQLDQQLRVIQNEYKKAREASKDQPPEGSVNIVLIYVKSTEKRVTELRANSQNEQQLRR